MANIGWWEIAIVLVLILIIFGPRKLPELGSSLGKSIRGFKKGLRDNKEDIVSTVAEVREATGIDEIKSTVAEVRDAVGFDEVKSTVSELKRATNVKNILSTQPESASTTAGAAAVSETTGSIAGQTAVYEATVAGEPAATTSSGVEAELPPEPPSTSKWVDSD